MPADRRAVHRERAIGGRDPVDLPHDALVRDARLARERRGLRLGAGDA